MAINLLDMIMSAQGGNTAQQVGAQLGLNQQQSQSAIAALLPAISSALKQNTNTARLSWIARGASKGQSRAISG